MKQRYEIQSMFRNHTSLNNALHCRSNRSLGVVGEVTILGGYKVKYTGQIL